MKYTDLIFDLYGTLADIKTAEDESVWAKTALYFGFHKAPYTPDQLKNAFYEQMKIKNAQSGESYECFPDIPFESVFSELFRLKGIKKSSEALGFNAAQLFRICSVQQLKAYHWVIPSLEKLKAKGYRLWLLSNAQRAFTEYELNYLNLSDKFDGIYLSSDFNCRKPDKRFFEALIKTEKLNPESCLMIGNDRTTDIEGAKNAGMATLFIQSNLTPTTQKEADTSLSPENAPHNTKHFEYGGATDWGHIAYLIYNYIDKS